jgi:hypothetical protein
MPADKPRLTFISYSRADKEFALALATELKQSGFRIWFDQLDIPTGARWDDEIENALKSCDVFMIILTSHSVASPNVRDEINYALGQNKRIMPILLEKVEIPFRLHRVQYVDFTNKSYEEGIEAARKQLKEILEDLNTPRSAPPVGTLINTDSNRRHGFPPADPPPNRPEKGKSLPAKGITRTMFFLAGLGLLAISCVASLVFLSPRLQDWISNDRAAIASQAPESNISFIPTTAVVSSPVPPPSEIPTSTDQPTATFTATMTPTLTPVDTATITPFSPAEPDQFLNFYFETIIYQRDFELGWSLLTDAFKSYNNPAGFEDWRSTWEKVVEWRRPVWSVRYATAAKAYVSTPEMWFRANSWYSLADREYCVVRDENRNTWMIEARVVCDQ